MNHGALPLPQGLAALFVGLLPVPAGNQQLEANQDFEALLAEVLAAGDGAGEAAGSPLLAAGLVTKLAGGEGKGLPPSLAAALGAEAGEVDPEALEALLAQLLEALDSAGPPPAHGAGSARTEPLPAELVAAVREALGGTARRAAGGGGAVAAVPSPADPGAQAGDGRSAPPGPAAGPSALPLPAAGPAGEPVGGQTGVAMGPEPRLPDSPPPPRPAEALATPPPRGADLPPPNPATGVIHVPVSRPEWSGELGQRVLWLAGGKGVQQAEIRLNPPQLGPLEVKVVMHKDEASVFFNAHHAVTREALEQALPRLREMLSASGLQLAEANVSGGDDRGTEARSGRDGAPGIDAGQPPRDGEGTVEPGPRRPSPSIAGSGLVDAYV